MIIATYSPTDIQLVVAGYTVDGWNSITVAKASPSFSVVKGIRGKNSRIRNKDSSATITVSVLQTSYLNDVFSEIVRKDILYGKGRIELTLKDRAGSSEFGSQTAFIEDYASAEYSNAIGSRDWTIHCLSTYQHVVGGNITTPTSVFDSLVGGASSLLSNIL